jgi:hypothetical protein
MAQTVPDPIYALVDEATGDIVDYAFTGTPGAGQHVVEVPASYAAGLSRWSIADQGWEDITPNDLIQPATLFIRLTGPQLKSMRTSANDDIQNSLFLLQYTQVVGVQLNDEIVTSLADAMVTEGIFDSTGRAAFLAAP